MKTKFKTLSKEEIEKKKKRDLVLAPIVLLIISLFIAVLFFSKLEHNHLLIGIPMLYVLIIGAVGKGMSKKLRVYYLIFGGIGILPSVYTFFFF